MKYFLMTLKVLVSIPMVLISIALFLGGAFQQTMSICAIVVVLFYWPDLIKKKRLSTPMRFSFIGLMLLLQFTIFKGQPKQSIHLSDQLKNELYAIYKSKMSYWPEGTEQLFIDTKYGKVHVLAYGDQ